MPTVAIGRLRDDSPVDCADEITGYDGDRNGNIEVIYEALEKARKLGHSDGYRQGTFDEGVKAGNEELRIGHAILDKGNPVS